MRSCLSLHILIPKALKYCTTIMKFFMQYLLVSLFCVSATIASPTLQTLEEGEICTQKLLLMLDIFSIKLYCLLPFQALPIM